LDLDTEGLKDKLLDVWDRLREISGTVWEEIVDRTLDLWDSFKGLDKNIRLAILGGAGLVIIVSLLIGFLYTPTLPLVAVQNTSGLTGEGNWIAVKNKSGKTLKDLNIIMDGKYIYYLEQIGPQEQVKILNQDFYLKLAGNKFGEQLGQDVTGETLLILSREGKVEIRLVEKKGWFGG